jgi:hypothetical protein
MLRIVNPYEFDNNELIASSNSTSPLLKAYRKGPLLIVSDDRALPPFCLWTNEPAYKIVEVDQRWQPSWTYALLLPGFLPYFFVSPFVNKTVKLKIPIGYKKYVATLRLFVVGLLMMTFSAAIIIAYFVVAYSDLVPGLFFRGPILLVILAFFIGLLGFNLAGSPIGRLNIVMVKNETVTIKGVHPDYLDRLSSL